MVQGTNVLTVPRVFPVYPLGSGSGSAVSMAADIAFTMGCLSPRARAQALIWPGSRGPRATTYD